jgi:CheY-like chemotaxis protein
MHLNDGSSVRTLLIERNVDVQEMFAELFATLGCNVRTVRNCTEALALAPEFKPHIIFSSLIFADMTGLELCSKLRAIPELRNTVFVALTGYTDGGIREKVREAGFHHYLLKPASFSSIVETFKSIPEFETTERLNA